MCVVCRWGDAAHKVFLSFCLLTNMLVRHTSNILHIVTHIILFLPDEGGFGRSSSVLAFHASVHVLSNTILLPTLFDGR
jgi:hypothetical protein